MPSYSVNKRAVAHARKLIRARQYVLDSDWGEAQPKTDDENAYLNNHSWDEYAAWHLGLTDRLGDGGMTPPAELRHKEVDLSAHELL